MLRSLTSLAFVFALVLVACSPPRYVYSPTVVTAADVNGITAATYPLPDSSRNGEVRLFSLGIVDLGDHATSVPAAHVRLVVRNDGEETWTVDSAEQRLALEPGRGPRLLQATTTAPERVTIVAPHEEKMIDLYFRLPEGRRTPNELLVFDALVVVRSTSAVLSERVRFERFRASPPASSGDTTGHPNHVPSRVQTPQPPHRWPPPRGPQ